MGSPQTTDRRGFMKALGGGAAAAVTVGGASTVAAAQSPNELDTDSYDKIDSERFTVDDSIDPSGDGNTRQNLVDINQEWGDADVIHVDIDIALESDPALLMFLPTSRDYEEWRNFASEGTYDQVYATSDYDGEFTFERADYEVDEGSRFYVAIMNPDTEAVRVVQGEITITRYEKAEAGSYRGFISNDPESDLFHRLDGGASGLEMGAAFALSLAFIEISLHLIEIHRHG